MKPIWMCPVCHGDLERDDERFVCSERHSFDVAREGYVNLVPAQHRRSSVAGDSNDSVRSRRAFLDVGAYEPLATHLSGAVASQCTTGSEAPTVLDIGCGEGYYLRRLNAAPS